MTDIDFEDFDLIEEQPSRWRKWANWLLLLLVLFAFRTEILLFFRLAGYLIDGYA